MTIVLIASLLTLVGLLVYSWFWQNKMQRRLLGVDAEYEFPVDGVHTIPVPHGWSPEQAWEAIIRGEHLDDPEPGWTNVVVKDGRAVEFFA